MLDTYKKIIWTNGYKHNWDDAYERMMAWWAGESLDRPVILADVLKPDVKPFMPSSDPGTVQLRDLDEDYIFQKNQHFLDSHLFLAEAAPAVRTGYASSIGMLGAMAGGVLKYTDGTTWIGEINDLYEQPLPKFSSDFEPYALVNRLIRRHHEAFGFDCVLGADAMMDPITTLSMLHGVEALCLDLFDRPDDVRRWLNRLSDIRQSIAEGYRREKEKLGRCEDINWTKAWAPGDMDFIECDFSTMISPDQFNEWVMPEAEKEAVFYDYVGWHLDGWDEIRHLESICSIPNLTVIQWVSGAGHDISVTELIDIFKKIRSFGRSILYSASSVEEAVAITKGMGPDGLAFDLNGCIKTEKDMEMAIKQLLKH